jgi:hypothetical protein
MAAMKAQAVHRRTGQGGPRYSASRSQASGARMPVSMPTGTIHAQVPNYGAARWRTVANEPMPPSAPKCAHQRGDDERGDPDRLGGARKAVPGARGPHFQVLALGLRRRCRHVHPVAQPLSG